ncbi:MAG: nucleotidyltransferase family protein [Sphingomonas sp.]|uniref:nucleotidyltransferase domain-containing protein n=1 Tax=Sphingomonas sp. TaxID=28214 RepID=UPI001820AEF9|nr:nucleotidyltransferase family protein [Sphingomonas sp.]MBA3666254.1 nucleotidyltransferase family protein [Sphingomonas sp.]
MAKAVDGDALLALARRNRVEGLVWRAINDLDLPVDGPTADRLTAAATSIAQAGMLNAAESARLLASFDRAGIPLLFLKGLTLGVIAYGDPFVKMGWDIDLLVAPSRIGDAANRLVELGYRPVAPGDARRIAQWHDRNKESVWRKGKESIFVELHGRLADHPALIPAIDVGTTRQSVEISPKLMLPTLADDPLFAYLCIHGASSAWFRLKWITDLAAFLHGRDPAEFERFYRFAIDAGAGRSAGQALLLAERLYAIPLGGLRNRLLSDPANRWLVASAMIYLDGVWSRREPTETMLGTLPIRASQLVLLPGWRFKMSEATRQLASIVRRGA